MYQSPHQSWKKQNNLESADMCSYPSTTLNHPYRKIMWSVINQSVFCPSWAKWSKEQQWTNSTSSWVTHVPFSVWLVGPTVAHICNLWYHRSCHPIELFGGRNRYRGRVSWTGFVFMIWTQVLPLEISYLKSGSWPVGFLRPQSYLPCYSTFM